MRLKMKLNVQKYKSFMTKCTYFGIFLLVLVNFHHMVMIKYEFQKQSLLESHRFAGEHVFGEQQEQNEQQGHFGDLEPLSLPIQPRKEISLGYYIIIDNQNEKRLLADVELNIKTLKDGLTQLQTDIGSHININIKPVWILNRISSPDILSEIQNRILEIANIESEIVVDPFDLNEYFDIPLVLSEKEAYDPLRNKRIRKLDKKFLKKMENHVYSKRINYFQNNQQMLTLINNNINRGNHSWVFVKPPYLKLDMAAWNGVFRKIEGIEEDNIPEKHVVLSVVGPNYFCKELYMGKTCNRVKIYRPLEYSSWVKPCGSCSKGLLTSELARFPNNFPVSSLMETHRKIYNLKAKTMGLNDKLLLSYNETVLQSEKKLYQKTKAHRKTNSLVKLINKLKDMGDFALKQKPYNVMEKTELPPSGDKHDYYTVKPYYWPDPKKKNGRPYIRRDGLRVPGTTLYDSYSYKFDRTALANMMRNTTILGLAYYFTDDKEYAEKAAEFIRTWFLDPKTRMTPHCASSQILWLARIGYGASTGVIEFQNFHVLLDSIRIIIRGNVLTQEEIENLKQWIRQFSKYLDTSRQGKMENFSDNNHGLYFDVQRASHAAFVGDFELYTKISYEAKGRVNGHFQVDGQMPREMERPTQLHYMMFTYQGWMNLGIITDHSGANLWGYKGKSTQGSLLFNGAKFNLPYFTEGWKHEQTVSENIERAIPMYYQACEKMPYLRSIGPLNVENFPLPSMYDAKPVYDEVDGTQVFWNLGLSLEYGVNKINTNVRNSNR